MKCKKIDLVGMRFGRWNVLAEQPSDGNVTWLCRCDCGTLRGVTSSNLLGAASTSCGCRKDEVTRSRNTTHGKTKSRAWNTWRGMLQRCHNSKAFRFEYYGGRGISVCKEWRESFSAFYADMGDPPLDKSLDRYPDKNGNYEPNNCRWATQKEQMANTRPKTKRELESAIPEMEVAA